MLKLNIDLPKNYIKDETRSNYKVTKKTKEIWAIELDLLHEFDRVCKSHKLNYYADSGTLLGAIRHKGFIPWDDDIDVAMFRDEYEALLKFSEEFKEPYFLQSFQTETEPYYSGHAQLRNSKTTALLLSSKANKHKYNQGIFIDIFVLDAVPNDSKEFNKVKNKIRTYNKLINTKLYYSDKNIVKRVVKKAIRPFININKIINKKETLLQKYNNSSNKLVSELSIDIDNPKLIRDKELYKEKIYIKFENTTIPCPIGYHKILADYYGDDYLTPKKEPTFHGQVFFDTEKSYKEYLL